MILQNHSGLSHILSAVSRSAGTHTMATGTQLTNIATAPSVGPNALRGRRLSQWSAPLEGASGLPSLGKRLLAMRSVGMSRHWWCSGATTAAGALISLECPRTGWYVSGSPRASIQYRNAMMVPP